ncbi:MAG: nucleoside 2-deoxyribosyltransferase domain-containing protein [Pseudonocardia sp.]
MRYIEAPQPYERRPDDGPALFLAGGITACPDWQRDACELLRGAPVVLLDPRRARYEFDPQAGTGAHVEQVAWEYRCLQAADATLFWFPACDPCVTVQPITLLELGTAIAERRLCGRRVVVGADPGYPRRIDVELQLRQALPALTVHETLSGTVAAALHLLLPRPPYTRAA